MQKTGRRSISGSKHVLVFKNTSGYLKCHVQVGFHQCSAVQRSTNISLNGESSSILNSIVASIGILHNNVQREI